MILKQNPILTYIKKNIIIFSMDKTQLAKVGQYILEGLSESEACILADVKKEDLDIHKEQNEKVRDYIEKCKVSFKYNHIKEMQTRKSEKTSQWLLERLRPEDFHLSNRSKNPTTVNIIGSIIQQIQQDERNRLITRNRADRFESDSESYTDDNGPRRVIEILN